MCKGLCSLFVGVFVGALVVEVVRRTEVGKAAGRKVVEGYRSARNAFKEGYEAAARPSPGSALGAT